MAFTPEQEAAFYPESKPFHTGLLKLDDRHTMAYEEFGNPQGEPIIFVHGGPGGGSPAFAHRFFDPQHFRIIVYDQRGAGKSTPYADTTDNSPDILVEDLKKLKDHLHIDTWHMLGGSWGSTLTLLYAQAHPEDVKSMVLRGVFTMRAKEVDWFMNDMGLFFPQAGKEFLDFLPPGERGDVLESYYKRLMDPDPAVHLPAARAWTTYETSCSFLTMPSDDERVSTSLSCARIEAAFFHDHMFTPDDRIIRDLPKIAHIPTMIVQGGHDVICPPETAAAVAAGLPNSRLIITPHGHASTQIETLKAQIAATDNIRDTGTPLPPKTAPTSAPAPTQKGPRL